MNELRSLHDLTRLRDSAKVELELRHRTGTVIAVGMGTCGIAAGARETLNALREALARHKIDAWLTTVGCIGMCANEPLVEIRQAGVSRVLYGNVTAEMIDRLVEQHLLQGQAVREWVVGRMNDW